MAIELTNSTVVKIIIRRGQNSDRKNIILSNGELGYVQDTQRLYVGDGVTYGGNPTSNLFLGFTSNPNSLLSISENGDLSYDTSNETLVALENGSWRDIHPKFDELKTFSKDGYGIWTLNSLVVAEPFYYSPSDGNLSLGNNVGQIDFNMNYLSLCANGGPDGKGNFYFGDIRQKTVVTTSTNKARVNVDGPLFVVDNSTPSSTVPKQLQFYSYYPSDGTPYNGNTTIRSISGIFSIASDNEMRLYSRHSELMRLSATGYGGFTRIVSTGGNYNQPNFHVQGISRFNDDAFYDQDVTVYGNLSVYGDATYLETTITTTSALSVVNINKNQVALHVAQLDPVADQTIARFITYNSGQPVLTIKDGPFVGVNVYEWDTGSISNANFVVSGTSVFAPSPGVTTDNFKVRTGTSGGIQLIAGTGGINLYGTTAINGGLTVTSLNVGNITSTGNYTNNAATGSIFLNGASSQLQAASGIFAKQLKVNNSYGISDSGDTRVTTIVSTSINTQDNNISMGTGDLTCDQIDSGAITCTTIDTQNNNITMGTGDIGCEDITATGTIQGATVQSTGDVIAYVSDKRLKENVQPLDSALEKICKLQGFTYNFNLKAKEFGFKDTKQVGLFAQDVEAILPEVIKPAPFDIDENGNSKSGENYKTIQYEKIVPLLIEAIKELNEKFGK